MLSEDSFQYAIENTTVVLAPDRRIDTFGSTNFRFHLVTELMDEIGVVRVRDGRIEAERPQIITPGQYSKLMLEGFGEQARNFADWLESRSEKFAFMKYGFQFRKTEVIETIVHSPLEDVIERIRTGISKAEGPLSAIIQGVDDAWEVCLLKFTVDLIQQSVGGNLNDFRRRGLL
ncbi:MAG: hypothetical protein WCP06_08995 [Verrucomicrobiota bacterium]